MNLEKQESQSISEDICPVRFAVNLIYGKWKLIIVWELYINKVMRFNELKRKVYGITNTMLSKSLEEMEQSNIISRTQYNEMPLRVEYKLTDKGENLVPILIDLTEWGKE